jgi:hypothetical protein
MKMARTSVSVPRRHGIGQLEMMQTSTLTLCLPSRPISRELHLEAIFSCSLYRQPRAHFKSASAHFMFSAMAKEITDSTAVSLNV